MEIMDANQIRHKLRIERQAFLDDLRPEYIMPALLDNEVLTPEEQKILSEIELSREDRVEKLLDFMGKKSFYDLKNFLKALRIDKDDCSPYPWLADILEKKDDLSTEAHKTLVNGDIPFPVNNLLNREEKLNVIRTKLKHASDCPRHWVVLHGPIGSGKTVLAAEAVRNNDVVENIFPGGVYWIYIGTLTDGKTKGQGKEEIKKRMKTLFRLMNCTSELYEDESIKNLKFWLQKEVVNRKNTLVILDSVWSRDVIRAFDIGCPILVTTNDRTILEEVSGFCSPLHCSYDLEECDITSLISMYVHITSEEMPIVVKDICAKCKGSPLVASLIGLRLADIGPIPEWWSDFNKKLEDQGMGTVRRRRASGGGDYNHDIKTLVHFSLESIREYKEYYQDFLIFVKDMPVPNEMLEILWGKPPSVVKDIMDELHHRCFVEKVKNEDSKYPSYMPHDIYLDVLKEDIENVDAWLKARHKNLIDQLHILPSGDIDLTSLPKYYIPHSLCYHLSKAEEYDLLEKICCNLRFIEQKIHLNSDPEYLYMDYHLYQPLFKNPKHVEKFEEFVRKNSANICKKADIIQLALFEPTDSIVYQKAKEIACLQDFGNYYDWCNKEESDLHFNCKIRDATNNRIIKYATFNSNGSLVATVGDTFAVIFSSTTGIELMELNGHSKEILYCAFNSKGDQVATASEDATVKIFKIDESLITSDSYTKKRLSLPFMSVYEKKEDNSMFTFSQHKSDVVHCEFSPNDQFIISGDITGIIFVWESTSCGCNPIILQMVMHGSSHHPLKYSYFNHDGTMFGSCCNDTIRIWNLEDEDDPPKTITYELPVVDFCFSRDKASVLAVINNDVFESNIESGDRRSILKYRSSAYVITSCCLSPDGSYFAYGTSSYSVIIINVHSHNIVAYFQGHNDVISNVMFSANGKRLLSVSSSRYIIHDIPFMKDKPLTNFAKNLSVRVNEDIVVASSNYFNSIEVRKGFDGKLVASSEITEEYDISACSLSYDCKEVVYGTVNGCLKVFNLDSKIINECLPNHEKRITYILHSKNKPTFFTCSEDNTIRIWEKSIDPLILKGHTQPVLMCAEFQTCRKLLSCSKDGTMKVWNTVNGDLLLPINEGHGNADVRYCDISQRGDLLASASSDETLKVWNSMNGQMRNNFNEEADGDASVKCCRFLPGKNILASGHDNGKVKLWSLLGRLPVEVLPETHDSAVHNILFQRDNPLKLLTLSNDIKLWHQKRLLQTIILPSTSMGFAPPNIWTSDDFGVIVVIVNYILYILKKI